MHDQARANAMRECFNASELSHISVALDMLACFHEDKANIQNITGINTKFKEQHKAAALAVRKLKNNLNL